MTSLQTRFDRRHLPDLAVLLTLSTVVIWYVRDALGASAHVSNLILVLPVAIIVLALCSVEFVNQLTGRAQPALPVEPIRNVVPAMGLFAGYVLSLNWLGFDVGTFAFVVLFSRIYGECRWRWALGYGISLATLLSAFFSSMLPYRMPMLIFPTGG